MIHNPALLEDVQVCVEGKVGNSIRTVQAVGRYLESMLLGPLLTADIIISVTAHAARPMAYAYPAINPCIRACCSCLQTRGRTACGRA